MSPNDVKREDEGHAAQAARARYARVIEIGTHVGMVLLALAFAAYVFGWARPMVPLDAMPDLWHHPVADYLQRAGLPTGWGWLRFVAHGDVATLIGVAVLAGVSLIGMLALIPLYAARCDRIYLGIVGAGSVVLIVAASSWLGH